MDNELKTMLESVISEALQPITKEIKELNQRIGGMENEIQDLNQRVGGMENEIQGLNQHVGSIENEMKNMNAQLDENTQITKAIYHRQEETDARLESLSLDVHTMHGEVILTKEQVADIKKEIEFTYQKTSKNELEIFKLRS